MESADRTVKSQSVSVCGSASVAEEVIVESPDWAESNQSVLWFGTMSATGKTLLLIYLEQILSFFLFWSLVSSFIMMSFYIISANERLEGVFNKPVSFVAEQIKALGADVANQPKVNEEKVKGNKGNKKKKRN